MSELAGAVVWAVVPFVPEAPFRLYAGGEHRPIEVDTAEKLIAAGRKGSESEFTFLVPAKARPVLIVSDRHDARVGELLALRLARLGALTEEERRIVRAHEDPALYPLDAASFALPEENAAIIAALVRVHRSAIDPRHVGRLGAEELRAIHERIATHYGLDLAQLMRREIKRLAEARRRRDR
ncbi:MAG: hypothetical protein EDQ89_09540 [Acidobacteria bacterium]|nr:MAG: hypothetical protein EDQ89_09540 [Acidobacteriota bacterium]MCL4286169.1 hypothetical protein [Thermoleophilia bacterium]GIK77707.1 MAG: hypothetical protein BroJett022_13970 [Actinomycetes bacterium]